MKNIEVYALVPDGRYTWRIVDEVNIFVVDIHDYDIEAICESIHDRNHIEKYSAEEFIESAWKDLRDEFSPYITYSESCDNWDKFCAWCDYQIMEYFTTTLSNIYQQRLLDFE